MEDWSSAADSDPDYVGSSSSEESEELSDFDTEKVPDIQDLDEDVSLAPQEEAALARIEEQVQKVDRDLGQSERGMNHEVLGEDPRDDGLDEDGLFHGTVQPAAFYRDGIRDLKQDHFARKKYKASTKQAIKS